MKQLAVFAAAIAIAGCGSGGGGSSSSESGGGDGGKDEGPITLGFAIGETGFMEPFDGPAKTAADFAIEDINADGGAAGRKFQTVSADTKSKAELSGDAATQVLGKGADIVVTSCDFDQGSPAAIVAQRQGVLAYSTCAASTSFGPAGIGPLAFTQATAAPAEGASMAEWAYEKKNVRKAFLLLDDTSEFNKQSAFGFRTRFEQLGGEVKQEIFKQDDDSIASQINALKAAKPDAVYLASYMPGEASAIKQLRSAGVEVPILADENIDGDYWKGGVRGLDELYFATYASVYGDDPDATVNKLVERYKAKAGKLPDTSAFLTGYAMVQALDKAIEGAGGSTAGAELQAQLEKFKDEPLLLPTTFDAKNHIAISRSLALMQIRGGKTSYLEEWIPKQVTLPDGS